MKRTLALVLTLLAGGAAAATAQTWVRVGVGFGVPRPAVVVVRGGYWWGPRYYAYTPYWTPRRYVIVEPARGYGWRRGRRWHRRDRDDDWR